jgi:glycosyltransferase involved in cell wall biosynthesis
MRILHICKSLNTALGGIQTHTRALGQALAQQGAEVEVLTGGAWTEELTTQIEGVTVIPMRYAPGYRVPGLRRLADDVAFNVAAWHWLRRHQSRYDLIHVQGRSGMGYAAWRGRKRPVVMTFHGLTQAEFRYAQRQHAQSLDARWHQHLAHHVERRAYRRANGVITVSSFMAGQLEARFGPRPSGVRVISNGITLQPETVREAAREAVGTDDPPAQWVTFLGRIEANKGVRHLPALLAALPPAMRLRVIGTGQMLPWLQAEMNHRGLQDRVEWVGAILHPEVAPQLEGTLALLVPSVYEPQGLVVLEAFERSIPVLASDVGGLREMVRSGENGWLVPPGDVASLAQYIRELAHYPSLAQAMGAKGRRLVASQYQWPQIAAQTMRLYQSILSS